MKYLLVLLLSFSTMGNDCESLFKQRGQSLENTNNAIACFESKKYDERVLESEKLNKLSYLYFFKASFFNIDETSNLKESYNVAKESINLFSNIFDSSVLSNLTEDEKSILALSYYLYGTSVSKYIDLMGKWEAIKRMSEISNSMTIILRMKKENTFHFGAYRTLAIFNLKVPAIAGGSLDKSKIFFEKLMKDSVTEIGVSSYPVGHYYYAEYLYRISKLSEACAQLEKLKNLSDADIETYFSDLVYETKKDREDAILKLEKYNCKG